MNILVLMAGSSQAFYDEGYTYPKMLTEVDNKPLVEHVINSFRSLDNGGNTFTFMVQKEDNQHYHLGQVIKLLMPAANIIEVTGETTGAACTALLGIEHIDPDQPLLILNGDQVIRHNMAEIIGNFEAQQLDGGIVVFRAVHPRWSYIRLDPETNTVVETAEKRPISDLATAGAYYFAKGQDYVDASMEMISKDASVDGLYYVCPAYNEMVLQQKTIGAFKIATEDYVSIMTPKALNRLQDDVNFNRVSLDAAA